MNFLGMGMFELAVIFLVAFLALGPVKSVEMARTAGKVLGDLRRTFNDVMAATSLDAEDLDISGSAPTRNGSKPKDSPGDSPNDSSNDSSNDSNGVGRQ